MPLYKKDVFDWVHPFMTKPQQRSSSWEVTFPFVHINSNSELKLCKTLTELLTFCNLDIKTFSDTVACFIFKNATLDAETLRDNENSKNAAEELIAGFRNASYKTVWETIGTLFNTEKKLAIADLTETNLEERATRIGLFITDPRVLYVIDSNEDIFDRFGFIAGGDAVYSALITESRAKRIPHRKEFADVLAWACIHNKIKNIKDMPIEVLLSVCCEQPEKLKTLNKTTIKTLSAFIRVDEQDVRYDDLLQKKTPITPEVFKELNGAEKAVLAVKRPHDVFKIASAFDINEINCYLNSKHQQVFMQSKLFNFGTPVDILNKVASGTRLVISPTTTVEDIHKFFMYKNDASDIRVSIVDTPKNIYNILKELKRIILERHISVDLEGVEPLYRNMYNFIS